MFKQKLQSAKTFVTTQFEQRPVEATAMVIAAAGAAAQIIKSIALAQNAQTWRREVNRRSRNS